jgi:hypothetical protein
MRQPWRERIVVSTREGTVGETRRDLDQRLVAPVSGRGGVYIPDG